MRPDVIQQGKARAGETKTRKGKERQCLTSQGQTETVQGNGEAREVNERRGKAKGRQKQVQAGQTRTTRGQGLEARQ